MNEDIRKKIGEVFDGASQLNRDINKDKQYFYCIDFVIKACQSNDAKGIVLAHHSNNVTREGAPFNDSIWSLSVVINDTSIQFETLFYELEDLIWEDDNREA